MRLLPHVERLRALVQVKVLAAAEQEGILDSKRVRQAINNALRQLMKRNQAEASIVGAGGTENHGWNR